MAEVVSLIVRERLTGEPPPPMAAPWSRCSAAR
jgi:hypothetical protein